MALIQHVLKIRGLEEAGAGLADLGDQAGRASKKLDLDLSDSLDRAGQQAGKLGQGLGVVSPTMGAMATTVADLADGMLALATPQGAVIGGVVALTTAAVGGVAAIAGMVVGLGALTLAADEALASLEGFRLIGSDIYPAVPPATLQSIKEANAALDALVSIGSLVAVEVGGNVAPAFAKLGKAAVGLGLEFLDMLRALTEGQSILKAVAVGVVSAIQSPFFLLLDVGAAVQDTMGALLRLAGQDVPEALQGNAAKITELKRATAEYVVGMIDLSAASSGLSDMYDTLASRGDTFVQQQMRATAAMEANTGAADSQAAALEKVAEKAESVSDWLRAMSADARAAAEADMRLGDWQPGAPAAAPPPAPEPVAGPSVVSTIGNVAGALQGGAGGLGGAVSAIGTSAGMAAAGPIVAAIMQVMQLVTALVPEDGAMGLQDQIHGFFMEFLGDLGELPAVLAKGMTESIREGIPALFEAIPALVEGLIAAIPELIVATVEQFPLMIGGLVQMLIVGIPKAILEGIGALFSIDLWKGLVDAMIAGFKEFFAPIFGNKQTGEKGAFQEGGYFDQVFVGRRERARGERTVLGSRATGDDYIPQTGLYLMHEGEKVAGNGRTMPTAGGSGGATIIVQGSVLGTVEDIARAFREAQRRGVSFG